MVRRVMITALGALALAAPAAQGAGGAGLQGLETRIAKAEQRFARVCESTPQRARCATVAAKIASRMDRIEARIAKRTAKITQRCSAGSTQRGCRNAADRLAKLNALNARAERLEAKARAAA